MADDSKLQEQAKKITPTGDSSEATAHSSLQQDALGLTDKSGGIAGETVSTSTLAQDAWAQERACGPESTEPQDFSSPTVVERDRKLKLQWDKFKNSPAPSGLWNSLLTAVHHDAQERVKAIPEDPATKGNPTAKLWQDLNHLRIRQGLDGANNYLPPEAGEYFYQAMQSVAVWDTINENDPVIHNGTLQSLAGKEVQKLRGAQLLPRDSVALDTAIFENLVRIFPMDEDKRWNDKRPWTPEQKQAAAQQMGLTGNYDDELNTFHNRRNEAALFAEIKPDPKKLYLQASERSKLNQDVLESLGDDLKVGQAWEIGVDSARVAKKYNVTEARADQMRERMVDIVAGKVIR